MPVRKDFRVIQGSKSATAETPRNQREHADAEQLRQRAERYRWLLLRSRSDESSGLVDDMEEAISALRRLESSHHPAAPRQAAEYRSLIAEIEGEIIAALKDG
jgi:hypothetical protein